MPVTAVSLGMLASRRRASGYPEEHLQTRAGDLGRAVLPGLDPVDGRQAFEWPGHAQLAAASRVGLRPYQPGEGKPELPVLPQGLGKWPRHFSDPQALRRGARQ